MHSRYLRIGMPCYMLLRTGGGEEMDKAADIRSFFNSYRAVGCISGMAEETCGYR